MTRQSVKTQGPSDRAWLFVATSEDDVPDDFFAACACGRAARSLLKGLPIAPADAPCSNDQVRWSVIENMAVAGHHVEIGACGTVLDVECAPCRRARLEALGRVAEELVGRFGADAAALRGAFEIATSKTIAEEALEDVARAMRVEPGSVGWIARTVAAVEGFAEISSRAVSTLGELRDRLVIREKDLDEVVAAHDGEIHFDLREALRAVVRCDGDHAAPPCAAAQCWRGEPVSSADEANGLLDELLRAPSNGPSGSPRFDFERFCDARSAWSLETFGPGARTEGVIAHMRKELVEVEAKPDDLEEWIDLVLLALDGAFRSAGADGERIMFALIAKHSKNVGREWPDWRTAGDGPIEHVKKDGEP